MLILLEHIKTKDGKQRKNKKIIKKMFMVCSDTG